MILVDFIGHMVSNKSEEELHAFAEKLGMRRAWFQNKGLGIKHPHYDLTSSLMVDKAIRAGAEQVTPADLSRRAWWSKEKNVR